MSAAGVGRYCIDDVNLTNAINNKAKEIFRAGSLSIRQVAVAVAIAVAIAVAVATTSGGRGGGSSLAAPGFRR